MHKVSILVVLLMSASSKDEEYCPARATEGSHGNEVSCSQVDSLTSDWVLHRVDFNLEGSEVVAKKHKLSSLVVTGPGAGSFSASGSKPQRAVLVSQSGEFE